MRTIVLLLLGLISVFSDNIHAQNIVRNNSFIIEFPNSYNICDPDKNFSVIAQSEDNVVYVWYYKVPEGKELIEKNMQSKDTLVFNLSKFELTSQETPNFFHLTNTKNYTNKYEDKTRFAITYVEYTSNEMYIIGIFGNNKETIENDFAQIKSSFQPKSNFLQDFSRISIFGWIMLIISCILVWVIGYMKEWVVGTIALVVLISLSYLLYDTCWISTSLVLLVAFVLGILRLVPDQD